ncbi:MAG: hypothetical protein M3Y21_02420 [Candidatus Eremiobacteraeota bacterium]|nr:hypothetical protein [Candidatus Eremiobacteraeota bacterium]
MRRQSQSTVLNELIWLGTFILIFVAVLAIVNLTIVAQGFNAKIGILLAAVISGVLMIGLRFWITQRKSRP